MFYADVLFTKRGALAKVWQLSYKTTALSKRDIKDTAIPESVRAIEQAEIPFALRAQGQLLLGIIKIYDGKVRFVQQAALHKLEEISHTERDRRRGVEAAAPQLTATNQQITVTDETNQHLYEDPLDEQRWLEQQQAALYDSSSQADNAYASLSLSLSQSQANLNLSQRDSLTLEQARRLSAIPPSQIEDMELGAGGGLELDLDQAAFQRDEGDQMMFEGDIEMVRAADRMSMASSAGGIIDATTTDVDITREGLLTDTSLIPADISITAAPIDALQAAADAQLIQQREARRQQKRRLRFAVEIRDEQVELEGSAIRAALEDRSDLIQSRHTTSLLNRRKQRERLITDAESITSLLHAPMIAPTTTEEEGLEALNASMQAATVSERKRARVSMGEKGVVTDPIAQLMSELFSVEGLQNVAERSDAAAAEGGEGPSFIQEEMPEIIPPDIELFDTEYAAPTEPVVEEPQLPQQVITHATAAELAVNEQHDAAAFNTAHSFFNDPISSTDPNEEVWLQEDQSTGFSSRTHKVMSLLQQQYSRNKDHVLFDALLPSTEETVSRTVAAGVFYQLLVLTSRGAIQCKQSQRVDFAPIDVQKGESFEENAARLLGNAGAAGAGQGQGRRRRAQAA